MRKNVKSIELKHGGNENSLGKACMCFYGLLLLSRSAGADSL